VGVSWFTAVFMHGSWDHILGNMLFLAIFGKNVEDAFGHLRYLGLYVAGGFIAAMTQAVITLIGSIQIAAAWNLRGADSGSGWFTLADFCLWSPACC
jgi:membrane associated rhomboid family serine protease